MSSVDKNHIVGRIQQRLNELGITANAASQMAGRNREWWGQVARKPAVWPATDNLLALCEAIGLRPSFALTGRGARLLTDPDISDDLTLVPRLSWVAAGRFTDAEPVSLTEIERFVPVAGLESGEYIALDVIGDSMNLIAPEGSTIIVNRRDRDLIDKKFYVVTTETGDAATFKRFRADWPSRLEPYSTNLDHKSINISEPIKVLGRVVRVLSDL